MADAPRTFTLLRSSNERRLATWQAGWVLKTGDTARRAWHTDADNLTALLTRNSLRRLYSLIDENTHLSKFPVHQRLTRMVLDPLLLVRNQLCQHACAKPGAAFRLLIFLHLRTHLSAARELNGWKSSSSSVSKLPGGRVSTAKRIFIGFEVAHFFSFMPFKVRSCTCVLLFRRLTDHYFGWLIRTCNSSLKPSGK